MRWFEGDITQAVTQSRARNAVFVVFVKGNNEASQRISSAIEDSSVSSKLEGSNFVAINLESGTQTFNQFSQIYRDPPVPSLYFIGRNGSPIEIVTETTDATSLMERIVHVENVHLGKPVANPSQSQQPSTTPGSSAHLSTSVPGTSMELESSNPEELPETSAAPLEDRVERAKELLEEKRMKKKMQEEEEAREKEMQRRKEGQKVQELHRWQQELELKQLKEDRLREKRLEQEAKQRVLDQIAQDRADRNSRNAASTSSTAPTQPAAPTSSPSAHSLTNTNEARLQFRLPDGTTHCNRFDADATLAEVRQYILSNITLPYRDFALATMFPRREFSSQDNASTLRDLELVPSSVVLIIPAGGSSAVQPSSPGLLGLAQKMLLLFTFPLTSLFSYIWGFFGGRPASSSVNPGPNPNAPTQPQNQGNTQSDSRSERRSGGAYRRTGNSNIHRLHMDHSSSDDENNTWNGNSTQQM